ncbi:LysM peptidoglycan-binding domain-containing protein [Paraburkholderia sp. MMS20-SJTN17]|uniref:LysM peptidoglycan-binding domain-containing protein n=1 Tax=Paraburkholderia translucens TaxID=2886945 RepID=A0ABS8K721_9BURK|nr:LysM peptidoglycan-binding domain-containing protein [Paraburkholderia sp. MMS20-SJTN17]MCC8400472.1 LysM peptidoglycan-binding domain-containing protein [Paraburkholderia sp. MMS20-SJTN17]
MGLAKMVIQVEVGHGEKDVRFDEHSETNIEVKFNPKTLSVSRSVSWQSQKAAKRDAPELQYTSADPATLSVDLFFDTYDSDKPIDQKDSVFAETKKLLALAAVAGDKHRPPVCRLQWGTQAVFFQGVLMQIDQNYTLFTELGTPVRATLKCSFKQWRSNIDDRKKQNLMSADVAKVWTVRRGQTLASIAAQEYADASRWRDIAAANGIDDPLTLAPGSTILLPPVRPSASRVMRAEDIL